MESRTFSCVIAISINRVGKIFESTITRFSRKVTVYFSLYYDNTSRNVTHRREENRRKASKAKYWGTRSRFKHNSGYIFLIKKLNVFNSLPRSVCAGVIKGGGYRIKWRRQQAVNVSNGSLVRLSPLAACRGPECKPGQMPAISIYVGILMPLAAAPSFVG